jgi:hypothetical protein
VQASTSGDRLSLSLPAGTHNLSLDPQ